MGYSLWRGGGGGSQKDRHDLATKHPRKGIFYLERRSIEDLVLIHSFFHQRVNELLHVPGLRPQK